MPEPKVEFYFEGPDFWAAFDAQRAEYGDGRLKILRHGDKRYIQVCSLDGTDGGDPINDAHLCPGSPGCP